jgi:hypothetical protein
VGVAAATAATDPLGAGGYGPQGLRDEVKTVVETFWTVDLQINALSLRPRFIHEIWVKEQKPRI